MLADTNTDTNAAAGLAAAVAAPVPLSPIPAANVASVPQRSPLRYPGGKTWLAPHLRAWLGSVDPAPRLLLEPFAGGAISSLTAVMEGLVARCLLAELDGDVAAFWQAALHHSDELVARIRDFDLTRHSVEQLAAETGADEDVVARGFRTLVLNRTRRGGILAEGAALNRAGENGRGVASRWYPDTIIARLKALAEYAGRIEFRHTDGLRLLEETLASGLESSGGESAGGKPAGRNLRMAVFVDPPYTAGGKRAGRRLYNHNVVDHPRLFAALANGGADFLMTYDDAPEIRELIGQYGFHAVRIPMKNTHHAQVWELAITNRKVFTQ